MFVPVVDRNHKPLMPTTPSRARRWIKRGEATPFWDRGIFCVRLNREPSDTKTQPIAVGIDPGSKKEGLTVKSASHTYLNINADAVTFVKEAKADQLASRRARRQRKTPCRQPRCNRARGGIPPSTKARWQWKLRLLNWLRRLARHGAVLGAFDTGIFVNGTVAATTTTATAASKPTTRVRTAPLSNS